jgi:hypothetical protein
MRETVNSHQSPEWLLAVLHDIEEHGSLLRLVPDRPQRLALMMGLAKQKLVVWNATAVKYELTELGKQTLAESNRRRANASLPGSQRKIV